MRNVRLNGDALGIPSEDQAVKIWRDGVIASENTIRESDPAIWEGHILYRSRLYSYYRYVGNHDYVNIAGCRVDHPYA